jgi:peptidoglycan hydrolase CwlO-like protein
MSGKTFSVFPNMLSNISMADLVTGLLSLMGVLASGFFGYLLSVKKVGVESRTQIMQTAKIAEQEFRDDLAQQLKDSYARLDQLMKRIDDRETRIADLAKQIDDFWSEKTELKSKNASLAAELSAAQRKIKDLAAELDKFEKKVFYIAPKEEK